VFQLSTAGKGTFDHIADVIPFFEQDVRKGRDFEVLRSPRIFKTHLRYRHVGWRPGRHIYIARDGRDVMLSYFQYYRHYIDSSETFPQFFDKFVAGRVLYGSWFSHVAEWKAHESDSHVLFVTYEELTATFNACLDRIASFCGWRVAPEQYSAVRERCSFASMKRIEHKFAPLPTDRPAVGRGAVEESHNRDADAESAFVRAGAVGRWKELLTPAQQLAFEQAGLCEQGDRDSDRSTILSRAKRPATRTRLRSTPATTSNAEASWTDYDKTFGTRFSRSHAKRRSPYRRFLPWRLALASTRRCSPWSMLSC